MYTPHTERDIEAMLRVIGVDSLDDLVRVPDAVALRHPVEVTPQLSEIEIAERFSRHAARNYGAHVTAVTISPAQFARATERVQKANLAPGSDR